MTSMKAIYFLSLDKTLYPMHNQVIFKQYNLNALVKYRMLFNSVIFDCCPFIYIYIYNVAIMLVFYHPGTESVTHYLINRLDRKQLLECQTISFDCLYTSFTLATWIPTKKYVTYIGALIVNRKDLPKNIKKLRGKSFRQNSVETAQMILSSVHMLSVHQGRKRRT